jgi:hypothetical protein
LEYNGAQNYKECPWFSANTLKERQEMDAFKVKKCEEKNIFCKICKIKIKKTELLTLQ